MKRFELSTLSLARRCSTTELHPHSRDAVARTKNHARQRVDRSTRTTTNPGSANWISKTFVVEFSDNSSFVDKAKRSVSNPSQDLTQAFASIYDQAVPLPV